MHQIKQFPQDFIVKEISNVNSESNGQYAYFILKKINLNTVEALQILSNKFKIPLKNFGFAGNKDKNAITEQKISIKNFSSQRGKIFTNLELNNIELEHLGNGKQPISLGDLEGNEFEITIRNLHENDIKKIFLSLNKKIFIPNFFGPQRFSKNNHFIGKSIIKKDFKKAVELVLENDGVNERNVTDYLKSNKHDYIGALRIIPLKTRKLFVHSYQSFLFNGIIEKFLFDMRVSEANSLTGLIKNFSPNIKIPIIGFDLEINIIKNKKLKSLIKKTLDEEKINPRDFIISQMPELSSEGTFRDLFFELKDLRILEITDDELNDNKKKIKINFTLPKSCYATVALEYVLQ